MSPAGDAVVVERTQATAARLEHVIKVANDVILGKEQVIRLSLACVLARGHLLIEDLPGVGKTTLAQVMARVLGLKFQRIQFTSDLLPADIVGVSVYERDAGKFSYHPGPIFAQLILADEVNRATPRSQSALLEAMEEHQVTVEGATHRLPEPFFVIATQNPSHQIGTFPLPESQLDRFLMRVSLGYPDATAERTLLKGRARREVLADLPAVLQPEQLLAMQKQVEGIHVSSALLDYLQNILDYSRRCPDYVFGLSPRAGLGVLRSARAWAMLNGRAHVLPEDIQTVLPCVAAHRLAALGHENHVPRHSAIERLIQAVPIP